jgi:CBS domain-containing protein
MCATEDSLAEVAGEMEAHRFGCTAVVQEGLVVGIFTTTDALRAVRSLASGEKVAPRTIPTHVVDVTGKPERHRVRLGDTLRSHAAGPRAGDGLVGRDH